MPIVVGDRVLETSTTSGTGTLTLLGAATGNQSFAAGVGVGNDTYYTIFDPTANTWEVGFGRLLTGATLSRTTVFSNSSGTTALISFAANSKNVFCTSPASKFVDQSDIGTAPNQIPLNQYLGKLAFQDNLNTVTGNPYYDTATTNLGPSLLLDFANSEALDSRITFTRASTATFYNGISSAKAEENMLLHSQNFSNAAWALATATLGSTTVTAPDGTSTAAQVTISGQYGYIIQNNALQVNGATYTASIWVQSVSGNTSLSLALSTTGAYLQVGSITVTGTWTRFTFTVSNWNSTYPLQFGIQDRNATGHPTVINIWGAQLEQRSAVTAYTPTTTAAVTNYIPTLSTAANGVARFDHNPVTGESLGLLIEEQRVNLLTYSSEFDNAAWTKSSVSLASNTIVAPDGTLTADKIVLISGVHQKRVNLTSGTYTANTYTMSCYAKAGEYGFLLLALYDTGYKGTVFNLNNGTIGSSASSTPSITPVGNGWYRCATTVTTTSTLNTAPTGFWPYATDLGVNGPAEPNGNGFAGLYIWGAQLEAGSFATSYIPTVASQVTRSADAANISGTNFSSWFNLAEGTIYCDATKPNVTGNFAPFGFRTANNYNFDLVTNNFRFGIVGQVVDLVGPLPSTTYKASCSYTNNGTHSLSINSSTAITTTGVQNNPDVIALFIGNGASFSAVSTSFPLNGYIKKLSYYPRRLNNSELVEMTA